MSILIRVSLSLVAAAFGLLPVVASAVPVANYFCKIETLYMPVDLVTGGRFRESGGDGEPCSDSFVHRPISPTASINQAEISSQPGSDLLSPSVLAKASSQGFNGGAAFATGTLEYHVELGFLQNIQALVFTRVPIHVDASGSVYTDVFPHGGGPGNQGFAIASADLTFLAGFVGFHGEVRTCTIDPNFPTPIGVRCPFPTDSFHFQEDVSLRVGESIKFTLRASAEAQGANISGGAPMFFSASATVDPYVWIDPDFMVMVGGVMVPATDVFTLVASPGISFVNIAPPSGPGGPAPVPLPPTLWLVAIGLLALRWRAVQAREFHFRVPSRSAASTSASIIQRTTASVSRSFAPQMSFKTIIGSIP